MKFWSGQLAEVKLNIFETFRFTQVKEKKPARNSIIYWSYNLILVHGTIIYQYNYGNSVSTSRMWLKNKTRACGTTGENHGSTKPVKGEI